MNHYANLKYVQIYADRHGKQRCYYRRGSRRVALPIDGSREECLAAYYAAAATVTAGGSAQRKRRLTMRSVSFEICINRILAATKSRSQERGWGHGLTAAWLREELARLNYRCELTGLPFSPARSGDGRNPFAPSADRKDNSKGYTVDNVRLVLASVNIALNDWGDSHFDQICRAYVAKQDGKTA